MTGSLQTKQGLETSQTRGQGPSQIVHGSHPAAAEGNTQLTEGATLENVTFMTIGKCNSEMHRTLLTKDYFSKFGSYNIQETEK